MSATTVQPAGTYARLAALPLRVEGYELRGLELAVNDRFTRLSTVVHLYGDGAEGLGEDTTYAPSDQLAFRAAAGTLPLAGHWTLASFSAHLASLDLFPAPASHHDFVNFRRWAFESAALDLALRQAAIALDAALGRAPRPVHFVVSPAQTSAALIAARLKHYPGLRLKLMAAADWDDATVDALASSGAVEVVDLKGQYDTDVPVAVRPDAALYRRVLRAFPDAWIEDPAITPSTEPVLRDHYPRITWDAPIRTATDIADLPVRPRMINLKPSRFGSVRALLEAYDYCARAGIGMYGGGQFELGPARGQIQQLASLFHPDAPNDVAPTAFNEPVLRGGLPTSPLPAQTSHPGFR